MQSLAFHVSQNTATYTKIKNPTCQTEYNMLPHVKDRLDIDLTQLIQGGNGR